MDPEKSTWKSYCGHTSLSSCILQFHRLNALPIPINIEQLIGENISENELANNMKAHHAKWHQSCYRLFDNQKHPAPYAAIRFTLGRASSCKILLHLNTMKVLNKFLKNGTGNYVEGVVNGRTGSGPVRSTLCETPHDTFKIASWNIGTMRQIK